MTSGRRPGEADPSVEAPSTRTPVTYDTCGHAGGPFYHGTRSELEVGAELVPGRGSKFQQGRVSNNISFTALVETATWGAELATALAGADEGNAAVPRAGSASTVFGLPLGAGRDAPTGPWWVGDGPGPAAAVLAVADGHPPPFREDGS